MDLEAIYVKKQGLNTAYVFFDSYRKTKQWEQILILNSVRYTRYVVTRGETTEYGFKMVGVRRKMLVLCKQLKEVIR